MPFHYPCPISIPNIHIPPFCIVFVNDCWKNDETDARLLFVCRLHMILILFWTLLLILAVDDNIGYWSWYCTLYVGCWYWYLILISDFHIGYSYWYLILTSNINTGYWYWYWYWMLGMHIEYGYWVLILDIGIEMSYWD